MIIANTEDCVIFLAAAAASAFLASTEVAGGRARVLQENRKDPKNETNLRIVLGLYTNRSRGSLSSLVGLDYLRLSHIDFSVAPWSEEGPLHRSNIETIWTVTENRIK